MLRAIDADGFIYFSDWYDGKLMFLPKISINYWVSHLQMIGLLCLIFFLNQSLFFISMIKINDVCEIFESEYVYLFKKTTSIEYPLIKAKF